MRCYVADLFLDYLTGKTFKDVGKIGSVQYEVEKDEVA
jgi:hypothetical protein